MNCITGVTQRSSSSIATGSNDRSPLQPRQLVGMLEQHERAGRDEVARRLAARVLQQHEEQVDLHLREPLAVDLGVRAARS